LKRRRRIDNVQELIILATYLNMKKLDDVREEIEGIMRGFQRLDALLDVVKELRAALERLEKSRSDEAAALLREVNTKLDQVLEKLGAFSIEETRRIVHHASGRVQVSTFQLNPPSSIRSQIYNLLSSSPVAEVFKKCTSYGDLVAGSPHEREFLQWLLAFLDTPSSMVPPIPRRGSLLGRRGD
jgi:hypothetical protein